MTTLYRPPGQDWMAETDDGTHRGVGPDPASALSDLADKLYKDCVQRGVVSDSEVTPPDQARTYSGILQTPYWIRTLKHMVSYPGAQLTLDVPQVRLLVDEIEHLAGLESSRPKETT